MVSAARSGIKEESVKLQPGCSNSAFVFSLKSPVSAFTLRLFATKVKVIILMSKDSVKIKVKDTPKHSWYRFAT